MAFQSIVRVRTANASRYLQQLCKHWAHTLAVEFNEEKGGVTFPRDARGADWPGDASLALQADAEGLDCQLEASAQAQLEALKVVVARHLDRFALSRGAARLRLAGPPSLRARPAPCINAHNDYFDQNVILGRDL
jgi:uncharacterized protein